MIQIYKSTNTNYDFNGDAVLNPISCELEMNLCGNWELTIENRADENIGLIKKEAVISVDTPIGKHQLFRIYEYEKTDTGATAYARPIFFDAANDTMLLDIRPTDKTGAEAIRILTTGTRYTGKSNIFLRNTAYYQLKNLIEALAGEDDNSFIHRWGGEPIYNNYSVIINDRAGGDYGARAQFGYNLEAIKECVNTDDVVTRIIPKAYNGYTLDGENPWVDSPNIDKYAVIRTKVITYSDVKLEEDCSADEEGFSTLEELQKELIKRAKEDFQNGIDLPSVSYEVSIVDLERTTEYEDVKELVKIGLGDTVRAENKALDITTTVRAVKIVYNCITQMNESVTLGDAQVNYFDKLSSTMQAADTAIKTDGTVKGEYIAGLIDLMRTKMRATAEVAEKQAVRAILFEDLDAASPTYGAMAIGTTGFMIAGERTSDGRDWDWRTFGTGKGFFADMIVAGTMLADRIHGGTLELGGMDNQSGVLKILNESGEQIGIWDNDGIKAINVELEGVFSNVDKKGIGLNIRDRSINFYRNGKRMAAFTAAPNMDASGNYLGVDFAFEAFGNSDNSITFMIHDENGSGTKFPFIVSQDGIKGKFANGKSGKAEFSDGSYLEFVGGCLTGGKTASGTTF